MARPFVSPLLTSDAVSDGSGGRKKRLPAIKARCPGGALPVGFGGFGLHGLPAFRTKCWVGAYRRGLKAVSIRMTLAAPAAALTSSSVVFVVADEFATPWINRRIRRLWGSMLPCFPDRWRNYARERLEEERQATRRRIVQLPMDLCCHRYAVSRYDSLRPRRHPWGRPHLILCSWNDHYGLLGL
jgi:hypothetical protein